MEKHSFCAGTCSPVFKKRSKRTAFEFASPHVVVEGEDERAAATADVALFPSTGEPGQSSAARGGAALAR